VVEVAKERLARREFEREKNTSQEAYEDVHVEEFAERCPTPENRSRSAGEERKP
jgi:hypothetical protein